jgi:sortase A
MLVEEVTLSTARSGAVWRRLSVPVIVVGLMLLSAVGAGAYVVASREPAASPVACSTEDSGIPPRGESPSAGEAVGRLRIPSVGIDLIVVEGVDNESLEKGPGHLPDSAWTGESGNVVISGHRTQFGGPFSRLDELEGGDLVELVDDRGTFCYRVDEVQGVRADDLSVLEPTADSRLTLTTQHPKSPASRRLVVTARLEEARATPQP